MSIEHFIELLTAISADTGIYLTGTLKYCDTKNGSFLPDTMPYVARDVVDVAVGGHTAKDKSGNFIVCSVERLPEARAMCEKREAPMVMSDIEPYINVDGGIVSGRRQHREYLKDNNLVEVGNEKKAFEEGVRQNHTPQRLTPQELARTFDQLGSKH